MTNGLEKASRDFLNADIKTFEKFNVKIYVSNHAFHLDGTRHSHNAVVPIMQSYVKIKTSPIFRINSFDLLSALLTTIKMWMGLLSITNAYTHPK